MSNVPMPWLIWANMLPQVLIFARLVAGVILGVFIYGHARRFRETKLQFPPSAWAAVVFVEPALGILVYWLAHRHAEVVVRDDELA